MHEDPQKSEGSELGRKISTLGAGVIVSAGRVLTRHAEDPGSMPNIPYGLLNTAGKFFLAEEALLTMLCCQCSGIQTFIYSTGRFYLGSSN